LEAAGRESTPHHDDRATAERDCAIRQFGNRRTARRRDWWGILRFSALLFLGGGIIRVINGLWQVLTAATWGSAYMIREIRHARRANRR